MKNPQSGLPPGFRFHPTDEELILHYLKKKITSNPFPVSIIADVDIYKFNPWDLPAKAPFGEKEWYFFSPRDRKYPNGARPNRAAASGYWKATGTDKVIMTTTFSNLNNSGQKENIGVKKALVFYMGRPPKGIKTNWIMHEYRLTEALGFNDHSTKPISKSKKPSMRLDDWVLCRIYKKSHSSLVPSATTISSDQEQEELEEEQFVQETLLPVSLKTPPIRSNNALIPQKSSSFSNLLEAMDYSILSGLLLDNQQDPMVFDSEHDFLNVGAIEQPNDFLNISSTSGSNSNSNISSNSDGSYLYQKLPQLSNAKPTPNMENKLKRQLSDIEEDGVHPSKKIINPCSFNKATSQIDMGQCNYLNQQFLLRPHLQFQG